MQYFITETQRKQIGRTDYVEFQKGQKNKKYEPYCWLEDSLLLPVDIFNELELYKIIPDFQSFGTTIIDKAKWNMMQQNAKKESGNIQELMAELILWVEDNFKKFDYFIIDDV